MRENRSIPRCTVIPELPYPDVGEAIEWLCKAFGFTLRIRIGNHRAQLNVGDGAVVVMEPRPETPPCSSSVMIRVEELDKHYEWACRHGAKVVREPANYPYGERQYSVLDFAGHRWDFSQSIADVAPESWGGTSGQL
jgi:uncharacterized glyoxalase superfamily protein PhnB